MNTIINIFLLTGEKFMPGFTYNARGAFTKHRDRIKKFGETGNLKHLCRNESDKPCFAHDAACSDSKDLPKRTISGKILKYRAHEIARNLVYDGHQTALASMIY